MTDPDQLPRVVLDQSDYVPEPGVPAWVRFLLRLAAIAWPFGTFWFGMRLLYWDPAVSDCVPSYSGLVLFGAAFAGTALLVRAVGVGGPKQRRALAGAGVAAAIWILILLLADELPPGLWCGERFPD